MVVESKMGEKIQQFKWFLRRGENPLE